MPAEMSPSRSQGDLEHVACSERTRKEGVERSRIVVPWTGGRSEVVHRVEPTAAVQWLADVVPDQAETTAATEMRQVLGTAGAEVIERHHLVAVREQTVAQVRAEEAGAAGNKDAQERCSLLQSYGNCPLCGARHRSPFAEGAQERNRVEDRRQAERLQRLCEALPRGPGSAHHDSADVDTALGLQGVSKSVTIGAL